MSSTVGAWNPFFLGLAAGLSAFLVSEYLALSPRWFRWVVTLSSLGVISRHVLLAMIAIAPPATLGWGARLIDAWASVGLTLPCAVAIDQMVRHPAMTPKKVLTAYAPVAAALLVTFITGGNRALLAVIHGAFALAAVWFGALLIRKLPGTSVRLALAGLAAAQVVLAGRQLAAVFAALDLRLGLGTDLLVLGSIWAALKTARTSPG